MDNDYHGSPYMCKKYFTISQHHLYATKVCFISQLCKFFANFLLFFRIFFRFCSFSAIFFVFFHCIFQQTFSFTKAKNSLSHITIHLHS